MDQKLSCNKKKLVFELLLKYTYKPTALYLVFVRFFKNKHLRDNSIGSSHKTPTNSNRLLW